MNRLAFLKLSQANSPSWGLSFWRITAAITGRCSTFNEHAVGQILVVKHYHHRNKFTNTAGGQETLKEGKKLAIGSKPFITTSDTGKLGLFYTRENKMITIDLSFSPQFKIKRLSGHPLEREGNHT